MPLLYKENHFLSIQTTKQSFKVILDNPYFKFLSDLKIPKKRAIKINWESNSNYIDDIKKITLASASSSKKEISTQKKTKTGIVRSKKNTKNIYEIAVSLFYIFSVQLLLLIPFNFISDLSIKLNIFLKEIFLSIWGVYCDHLIF